MTPLVRSTLVALLCLIWGSTWLAIKVGLEDLPPFFAAGVRFAAAAAILFALARARKVPFPRSRSAHVGLFGLGLTSFWLSYGLVYWAEQYLTSGLTAVLFATLPLFTLLQAHLLIPAERLTLRKGLGVALGFIGVVLIYQEDLRLAHPRAPLAAGILLLGPFASAAGAVGIKRWASHIHPFHLTILPMAYGAAGLLLTSLLTERAVRAEWSWVAVGSVAYLAVFGSVVAFVVYYTLLRQVAVSTLNLISYVFPVVAVVLGYLILGEVLQLLALAGGALILAGIAVATWRRRVSTPASKQVAASTEAPSARS